MTKQLEQSGQKFGQSYALPVLEASIDSSSPMLLLNRDTPSLGE